MLYPTIHELTKEEFNRYELALATAKCARIITGEYVKQREAAERATSGSNKDTDRPLMSMIDEEYRDQKAVKVAVSRLHDNEYSIVRLTPEEMEEEAARAAALEIRDMTYSEIPDTLPLEDLREDGEDEENESAEAEDVAEDDASQKILADDSAEDEDEESASDENA